MFAHLVPQRTPGILIPFIVLIESIRNIIRPATLAVRLTANIIAGHLLITLLGNQTAERTDVVLIGLLNVQMLLIILEMAVSVIQAYVFRVLLTLYTREIHSH
jgi:F-type H+-transporting ATPase subunit a